MSNVVDIYPNEVVEREANAEELIAREELANAIETKFAEDTAKAEAKAELLARLGLTAEEAALLLS